MNKKESCDNCQHFKNSDADGCYRLNDVRECYVNGGARTGAYEAKDSALDVQVGGGHYKSMLIQPVEFCFKNKLNNCQSNIIKYVTRYESKNGIEDLKKAKHYIDLLIQLEYGGDQ